MASRFRFYLSNPHRIPWGFAIWKTMRFIRTQLKPDRPSQLPKSISGEERYSARHFRQRRNPRFFAGADEAIVSASQGLAPWKHELKRNGDRALEHWFEYAGFGLVKLDEDIDWTSDPFQSSPGFCDRAHHPDLRAIWELNRCSQFPVLALAYRATGDERYVKEIVTQMQHWGDRNPWWSGLNWQSSMEASIRIVNWIWTFNLIRSSRQFNDTLVARFLAQVLAHGIFIDRNLERSATSNNHYLAGSIGLLHLGITFPELNESRRWLRIGKRIMYSEVLRQTYADGAGFEGSIPYHGLNLELLLPTTVLCRRNGINVPRKVMNRIEKMLEFVAAYSRNDGTYPQFGDRDDGHLMRIVNREGDSHQHLLAIGAVIFRRGDFKRSSGGWDLHAELLLGSQDRAIFDEIVPSFGVAASSAFLKSGYFFMRHEQQHAAIDCADVGLKGRGGHGHNDCLSFELHAYDRAMIVDSGTFQYALPEETRRTFQGTAAHNTAVIDNQEIARFVAGDIWGISDEADPVLHFWNDGPDYSVFEGSHNGYRRLDDPVVHTRRIILKKNPLLWVVVDNFFGTQEHEFKIIYHLSPELCGYVSMLDDGSGVVTNQPAGPNLILASVYPSAAEIEIGTAGVSCRYGHLAEAPVIRFTAVEKAPWSLETCVRVLSPNEQAVNPVEVRWSAIVSMDYWNDKRPVPPRVTEA